MTSHHVTWRHTTWQVPLFRSGARLRVRPLWLHSSTASSSTQQCSQCQATTTLRSETCQPVTQLWYVSLIGILGPYFILLCARGILFSWHAVRRKWKHVLKHALHILSPEPPLSYHYLNELLNLLSAPSNISIVVIKNLSIIQRCMSFVEGHCYQPIKTWHDSKLLLIWRRYLISTWFLNYSLAVKSYVMIMIIIFVET